MKNNKVTEYLHFLAREFLQPVNYLIAIGIGLLILLLQGSSPFSSFVPYVVPVFVQAFSKSYVKFSSRYAEMLLSLPGRRSDPAFLMDAAGTIELSTGKTRKAFEQNGISSLDQLFDKEGKRAVMRCVEGQAEECGPVEAYSPVFERWYNVKTGKDVHCTLVLVWMDDITTRRDMDNKLAKIRDYTDSVIIGLDDLIEHDTSFVKLADLILDIGYEGVFIAEKEDDSLVGSVYKKRREKVETSEKIVIDQDSNAPIWLSRKESRLSYDEVYSDGTILSGREGGSDTAAIEEFGRKYPFDRRVVDFVGRPIKSFVNYHEGEISIIAFNLNRPIVSGDLLAMEVLINSARSVSSLLSLASENDQKFLQSVTGLCSAAEYSDEITGTHILRVNEYSRLLAGKLGMAERGQKHIGQVAAMHDIGKVAIPHLIKLDRRFTPEERRNMEMHTIYGAQIIEKMMTCCNATEPRLAMAYEIALNHHQQWNGKGYPPIFDGDGRRVSLNGKSREDYDRFRPAKGAEIPLTARIVSIADTYDALRSARQYKPEKSHRQTVDIINTDDRSGVKGEERFGSDVMELFAAYHKDFDKIFEEMKD